jgi:predicted ATP-grasp superfamily ATP-dependent carboligase
VSALYEFHQDPGLDGPALLLSLEGWIDAGAGAATAAATILPATPVPVATFDSDTLLDHRARRPVLHIVDGVTTGLTWPAIELVAFADLEGRDVLFLSGPEPDHNWPTFAATVVALADELGVTEVYGLGAYPAPVPHTRPVQLASTASSAELARKVGFIRGTLDVPAGVAAAIEREAAETGLPALGLWAQVPHYAAAMPYPAASLRLLEGLFDVAGLRFDTADLDRQAKATSSRLDALIADSDEHRELVHQLELHVDQPAEGDPDAISDIELRSGDELAAEFERFLREQGD